MDRWRLPVGLAAGAGKLRWGRGAGERLNWRFIYPIRCQGRLVGELSCVCSQNAKISMHCLKKKKGEREHEFGGGNQWPLVASSFKLPAPLKAVLTGHYGCLLKTRQRKEEWSCPERVVQHWHKHGHAHKKREAYKHAQSTQTHTHTTELHFIQTDTHPYKLQLVRLITGK